LTVLIFTFIVSDSQSKVPRLSTQPDSFKTITMIDSLVLV